MMILDNFQNSSDAWWYTFRLIFMGFLLGAFLMYIINKGKFYDEIYKRGQIDAINGRVKYEKMTNEDGETYWREIKKDPKQKINKHHHFTKL